MYPNWKKKSEAEIIEYHEQSGRKSKPKPEQPRHIPLPLPSLSEIQNLENQLEALDTQENHLQSHLDSLEQFLFKEKQYKWSKGKKKIFFGDSDAPSIASVREMMTVSKEGAEVIDSRAQRQGKETDHGQHFRPPGLHRRDQPEDQGLEVLQQETHL